MTDAELWQAIAARLAPYMGAVATTPVQPPVPPVVSPPVQPPPVVPVAPPPVVNPDGSLQRLTGAALHAVLTGNFKNAAGQYSLPGISDPNLAMRYVQSYLGQPWYDPTISELANMPDGDFREMLARYATPAEWLVSRNKRSTGLDKYGLTWAKVLPYTGR